MLCWVLHFQGDVWMLLLVWGAGEVALGQKAGLSRLCQGHVAMVRCRSSLAQRDVLQIPALGRSHMSPWGHLKLATWLQLACGTL